jgi:hypothetical protein
MGFRAARGWVWCSPPRRATAKVPLRPGCCDGVLRWGAAMGCVAMRCVAMRCVAMRCVAMRCVAMRCGWVAFRSAPTGHGIPAQGETLGTLPTQPMRSEGTPHRCVGQALEGCVSGAGSAVPWPPRAQEALGRMGFCAAREWVWCSPPRRATAKVPLPPGWCDGVVRWGMAAMGCGWVVFRSAPTGHGIPAQGETP